MDVDNDESVICLDECPVPMPKPDPRQKRKSACQCVKRRKRGSQIKHRVKDMVPIDVIDLSESFNDDESNGKRNPLPGECGICLEPFCNVDQLATIKCGHIFCKQCINRVVFDTRRCPKCRSVIPDLNEIITLYP